MNYRNIKDLNTVILQNSSINNRNYRAKAYISKSDVFCLGTAYNQLAVAAARISEQPPLCQENYKMFLESESFKNTLTSEKHALFFQSPALNIEIKL